MNNKRFIKEAAGYIIEECHRIIRINKHQAVIDEQEQKIEKVKYLIFVYGKGFLTTSETLKALAELA